MRKERLVKHQLSSHKNHMDFTRINVMNTQTSRGMVNSIVANNFEKLFNQNLLRLTQDTGMERQDIINIYTRFVSIYMLQQLEDPAVST